MKPTMNKIGMEIETVFRIIFNGMGIFCALCALIVICLERLGMVPFVIAVFFLLLFLCAVAEEVYERILYDDSHFEVRSFLGTERIAYADIVRIERVFIRHQSARSGGHWRYHVRIKTADGSEKNVIVPFPQFITNEHLQDLFTKIKHANPEIQWAIPVNR